MKTRKRSFKDHEDDRNDVHRVMEVIVASSAETTVTVEKTARGSRHSEYVETEKIDKQRLYRSDKSHKLSSKEGIYSRNDNSGTQSRQKSKLVKTSGGKKGRNLDLVVSRMLKAKKESEEPPQISCELKEIASSDVSINRIAEDKTVDPSCEPVEAKEGIVNKSRDRRIVSKDMIDIQQPSNENHLVRREEGTSSPTTVVSISNHRRSSPHHIAIDSCGSTAFSPFQGTEYNPQTSNLRPFVQSSPKSEDRHTGEDRRSMSPIIKHEPVAAPDSRLSLYHHNGPALNTHSPASSYNSQPSPEQRSLSPGSPRDGCTEGISSSPPLALNSAMRDAVTRNAAIMMMNGDANPHQSIRDLPYVHDRSGPGVAVAAMAASGLGLPTLVPTVSSIPPNAAQRMLQAGIPVHSQPSQFISVSEPYSQSRRNGNDHSRIQMSPNVPTGLAPTRGIIGHKEAAAASEGRGGRRGGNVDEKCPYKRPPHTYPALIASAILDSPGNLITLRGIYDYIMNNFPYYKFGHDKSAWQNSIRHNLSLNQCFVKVPRYENAAKSNYWTMTPDGFEEFGNENSFKRRRRRGAALAPISAYKNKKCNGTEGGRNGKQRSGPRGGSPLGDNKPMPGNLPNFPGRSRTPEAGVNYSMKRNSYDATKSTKRAGSPESDMCRVLGGKHPRMMVLKRGEGPNLEGISGHIEHPQRPNSLSSVEEMQGNLNSFSKTLSAATENSVEANRSPKRNLDRNSPAELLKQQWMVAAMQKNLFSPGFLPELSSSTSPVLSHQDRFPTENRDSAAVILDGVEIGVKALCGSIGSSATKLSYSCRFCEYKYADDSPSYLEKHCQLIHQLEMTNARAKAVAAAAVAGRLKDPDTVNKSLNNCVTDQPNIDTMAMPNMVPGLSPSMFAAAANYTNAQNFFAAAQAAGLAGLPLSAAYNSHLSLPNTTNVTSHFVDTLTRAVAQQMKTSNSEMETIRRHRFPPTQTPMSNTQESSSQPQEQLQHLIYQQLMSNTPFFPGSTMNQTSHRPVQNNGDMTQLAQQLWQYQKALEIASHGNKESSQENASSQHHKIGNEQSGRSRRDSSSSTNSRQNDRNDADYGEKTEDNIHGWKQCQDCDFTAKGAHGLELHYRKVHGDEETKSELKSRIAPNMEETADIGVTGRESSSPKEKTLESRDERLQVTDGTISSTREYGTQTCNEDDVRTCVFCNITFGDDTMYALHMTCHDKVDPFRCKICDKDCHEKYYFNVHLLQGLHQPSGSKAEKSSRAESTETSRRKERASSSDSIAAESDSEKQAGDVSMNEVGDESTTADEQS